MNNSHQIVDESNEDGNSPICYEKMSSETKEVLLLWIKENFTAGNKELSSTSYGLKHAFEDMCHVYVSNGEFKGAMLASGYQPVDPTQLNWTFRATWTRKCHIKNADGSPCRHFQKSPLWPCRYHRGRVTDTGIERF